MWRAVQGGGREREEGKVGTEAIAGRCRLPARPAVESECGRSEMGLRGSVLFFFINIYFY